MRRPVLAVVAALAIPIVASACSSSAGAPAAADAGAATASLGPCPAGGSEVTPDAVKTCLGKGGTDTGDCLDQLFAAYLKDHTTEDSLALLQCYGDHDPTIEGACHPVAHAIGRDTFVVKGVIDQSFAACNQTCHSGCYHGVMERFLRGDAADQGGHISFGELQAKIATACPTTLDQRIRFQCLHGLGHAILYYSGYDLRGSLKLCESTGDGWAQSSCWGGVFMENVAAAEPALRDLSPTDYHYPCDALDDVYKGECYVMQTSRMTEMGLTPPQIFDECRKAGIYTAACLQSLGRDLSNDARTGNPRGVSSTCELGVGDEVSACTRGVVYALIDNTWDGRFALPYCPTYAAPDNVTFCYQASVQYLTNVYGKTDLPDECAQYAPGNAACAAAASP
jgi:hypothetical protein